MLGKSGKCRLMVAVARGYAVLGAHADTTAVTVVSAAIPAKSMYQWLFNHNTWLFLKFIILKSTFFSLKHDGKQIGKLTLNNYV